MTKKKVCKCGKAIEADRLSLDLVDCLECAERNPSDPVVTGKLTKVDVILASIVRIQMLIESEAEQLGRSEAMRCAVMAAIAAHANDCTPGSIRQASHEVAKMALMIEKQCM